MHHVNSKYIRVVGLLFLVSAGLILASSPANGQVSITPGVRAGVNSATLGGDTEEYVQSIAASGGTFDIEAELGRRTGFLVGGYLLVDLAGPLSIQPEARYIQKGFDFDLTVSFQGQSATSTGSLNLSYLDVPVLVRYDIPVEAGFSPHLIVGPRVGVNLSAETEAGGTNGNNSGSTDVSDSVSDADFGLEFGAGVGFGTVSVDLRYGLGLSNIIDSEDSDLTLSNRSLMVTAGLTF